MARAEKSVLTIMSEQETAPAIPREVAATALQQRLMEEAGELQKVHYIGPHGNLIPGFYSSKERAFLPQFKLED